MECEISLKEMSVQYWPSEGTAQYGLASVTLQDEKLVGDYVIRKFRMHFKQVCYHWSEPFDFNSCDMFTIGLENSYPIPLCELVS